MTRCAVRRRQFLATVLGGSAVSLAGCFGGGINESGKQQFGSNPVASDIESRPSLGADRADTGATLVMFSDPSCPSCHSFHEGAFQKIKSDWIDSGTATLYTRQYPYVAEWAETAIYALAEVYKRQPEAYWSFKSSYFSQQDSITTDNVVSTTRTFLEELDVDTEAVVTAVQNSTSQSYVEADIEAGDEAGLYGVPLTFLFEDGEFVTALMDESFEAFRSALESHA